MINKNILRIVKNKLAVTSLVLILLTFLPIHLIAAGTNEQPEYSKLEIKIAKGYSNKFCNAIGIGVSG